MLSTNEEYSLKLTPEDRRWGAFECSSNLKGRRLYFKDLARYWRLHQSKTDVLNTLLGISTLQFDAEKHRPITPYLDKLMHWSLPSILIPALNIPSSHESEIQNELLPVFLNGMTECLRDIHLRKIKTTISTQDLFYEQGKYWIKVSLIPDLYYLWIYGTSNSSIFTNFLWKKLADEKEHQKICKTFKSWLNQIAPELKSQSIYSKSRCSYYSIDMNGSFESEDTQTYFPKVDIINLYQKKIMLWKDLGQNLLSMSQSARKHEEGLKDLLLPSEMSLRNPPSPLIISRSEKNALNVEKEEKPSHQNEAEGSEALLHQLGPQNDEYDFLEDKMSSLGFNDIFKADDAADENG